MVATDVCGSLETPVAGDGSLEGRLTWIYENRGYSRATILHILIDLTEETNTSNALPPGRINSPGAVWTSGRAWTTLRPLLMSGHCIDSIPSRCLYKTFVVEKSLSIGEDGRFPTVCMKTADAHALGPILFLRILERVYNTYGINAEYLKSLKDHPFSQMQFRSLKKVASQKVLRKLVSDIVLKRIVRSR
ncbi:hypothetical protein M422DRAFT_263623 [Sphaerobolus stellatus SS14]|uniref:Uncharacterized protein n=1 Tax=Sphaerobolus stellatus (strain SS14) TaxID=990650 RepID=A0A0C9VA13_SPHS4|nr:hypothetical protein M422DRAFT_263623 [Sphaerobolus stellatus SS14]